MYIIYIHMHYISVCGAAPRGRELRHDARGGRSTGATAEIDMCVYIYMYMYVYIYR